MTIDYRTAAANELTQIADLRWRLHVDDNLSAIVALASAPRL
jgi:hypothetical protein